MFRVRLKNPRISVEACLHAVASRTAELFSCSPVKACITGTPVHSSPVCAWDTVAARQMSATYSRASLFSSSSMASEIRSRGGII